MMEFEYSPRHSPGNAAHLLSPGHVHGNSIDGYASIQQLRRSLSKSPSKQPARYSLATARATSASPPAATSSTSAFSRAHSTGSATDPQQRPKFVVKRSGPMRTASRKSSPNSPLRRALSDNASQANVSPQSNRKLSIEGDQENMDCSADGAENTAKSGAHETTSVDFLKPDKLLQPAKDGFSPAKSSPLKRSDGVMNLEAATFENPRAKRRSLHGASLGNDFNVFDQGFDGSHSDSAGSSEETESHGGPALATGLSTPITNSPQRRPLSLRKSTLQQRAAPGRPKHLAEAGRDGGLSPSLTRARSRISLDSALPLRTFDAESPFRRGTAYEPPVLFPPPAQRAYQSAPKPHPLSHALTPSSSASSIHNESSQSSRPSATFVFARDVAQDPPNFSQSLPISAQRPDDGMGSQSSQNSSQESFTTPAGYKMAKPLPQAFMSTGLISKRNRNLDMQPTHNLFSSVNMPDTPSKKVHVIIPPSPAPGSALGAIYQPSHEFGSPSTPFNARTSNISPESQPKGVNIFGSRMGAPQMTRRCSFLSVDGEDVSTSPTHQLESQSSNDDLPPTPTKSSSTNARPQSKGKSNSLRSSLFGRRTSLGPDTFASPAGAEPTIEDTTSKYTPPLQTPRAREEEELRPSIDDSRMPFIILTACTSTPPSLGRTWLLPFEQMPTSPSLLARRSAKPVQIFDIHTNMHAEDVVILAESPEDEQESATKQSPHTPHESYTPPDPSSLSISVDRRPTTALGSSMSFPPATPTGPREHPFNSSLGQGHASSSYFSNDVDTALTSRFDQVTTLGLGEFSQVYRVEAIAVGATHGHKFATAAGKVWAVKKSRKPYMGQKDRQRQMREVRILQAMRGQEHVVELVDSWESKNHLYIQLDFCENGNLKDFLTQTGFKGRLDDFRIWKILFEMSLGVKSIHDSGFIHLDLKPANVFIDWEGALKIGDFGLASEWPAPDGLDGEGDREYIGPEVLSGRFDKPADIFSLGMMMLEIAGNIILPDNGTSWQRLRAGDLSDLPSLTWSSDSSLVRDESGDPVDMMHGASSASLPQSPLADDDLAFLRPALPRVKRTGDLVKAPNFMVDPNDPEALDGVVQGMISPDPNERPVIDGVLAAGGVQWVSRRRRAGATVYEGNWGPADDVLNHDEQDVEMMDI